MYTLLSAVPAILMVASLSLYIYHLLKGRIVINLSTWIVTLGTYAITVTTLYLMYDGDMRKMAMYYVISVCLVFIFLYAVKNGTFKSLESVDYVVIGMAGVAVICWLTVGGSWANVLIQIAVFISFLPMVEGLIVGTVKDHPTPWLIGVAANLCQILVIWFDPEVKQEWFVYVNPVLIGIGVNLMVAYAARRRS